LSRSHLQFSRPDQLLLEDDPAFLPDILFALLDDDFDLLNLNTGLVTDTQSTSTSALATASKPLDKRPTLTSGGIVLPTSDTGDMGDFLLPGGGSSHGPRPSSLLAREEDTVLAGDLFDFDADGNVHEFQFEPNVLRKGLNGLLHSDATASARVHREHLTGHQASLKDIVSIPDRTQLCKLIS
jgi:meiotic recombination protein REC8